MHTSRRVSSVLGHACLCLLTWSALICRSLILWHAYLPRRLAPHSRFVLGHASLRLLICYALIRPSSGCALRHAYFSLIIMHPWGCMPPSAYLLEHASACHPLFGLACIPTILSACIHTISLRHLPFLGPEYAYLPYVHHIPSD
jgi:hypothetical protein